MAKQQFLQLDHKTPSLLHAGPDCCVMQLTTMVLLAKAAEIGFGEPEIYQCLRLFAQWKAPLLRTQTHNKFNITLLNLSERYLLLLLLLVVDDICSAIILTIISQLANQPTSAQAQFQLQIAVANATGSLANALFVCQL